MLSRLAILMQMGLDKKYHLVVISNKLRPAKKPDSNVRMPIKSQIVQEKQKNVWIINFSCVVKVNHISYRRHTFCFIKRSLIVMQLNFIYWLYSAAPENGTIHEFACQDEDPLTDYFFDFNDIPRLTSYNVSCTNNG